MWALGVLGLCLVLVGCRESTPPLVYQAVAVERRDIVISALAAGVVEPDVTVEVKSKASGELLEVLVESGDLVERGTLLVRIDQRQPRNTLALAAAELDVAQARLATEEAQKRRSEKLFKSESIPETEYEQALLDHVNARAGVVRASVAVENAQIEMDDTEVLAPITGTVIREERRAWAGHLVANPGGLWRYGPPEDGGSEPGAGSNPGRRDRHRQDLARAACDRDGWRPTRTDPSPVS